MEALQRLQPLDFLLLIVWGVVVSWGALSGVFRQLLAWLCLFAGVITARQFYEPVGNTLLLGFERDVRGLVSWFAYVALFVLVFSVTLFGTGRAYPGVRIIPGRALDSALGTLVAAAWGAMLLVTIITSMRYFSGLFWPSVEFTQQIVDRQVSSSQVALALEKGAPPVWAAMVPWFPVQISPNLQR